MGITGIGGETSSAAAAKRVEVGQVRESAAGGKRAHVVREYVGSPIPWLVHVDGCEIRCSTSEVVEGYPVLVGIVTDHVELRETRESLDGSERALVADRVDYAGAEWWAVRFSAPTRPGESCTDQEVQRRWPVVVSTSAGADSTEPQHPGAPPPHDDANPHARHALCQMLERLGGDGATDWMNGVEVSALQDELYRHCREMAAHEKHPLLAKIGRLEAMVTAEAARADAWMDFADALHKRDNVRLAAAGIAVSTATLAARRAARS